MNSEAEKLNVIRRHFLQTFPNWRIEDGSRTSVDRTLQLFDGVPLKCTIQIGLDLLLDAHRSSNDLEVALRQKDVAGWVRSAPVVYLNNNTLGLTEG
jgi:hypothetical protein